MRRLFLAEHSHSFLSEIGKILVDKVAINYVSVYPSGEGGVSFVSVMEPAGDFNQIFAMYSRSNVSSLVSLLLGLALGLLKVLILRLAPFLGAATAAGVGRFAAPNCSKML